MSSAGRHVGSTNPPPPPNYRCARSASAGKRGDTVQPSAQGDGVFLYSKVQSPGRFAFRSDRADEARHPETVAEGQRASFEGLPFDLSSYELVSSKEVKSKTETRFRFAHARRSDQVFFLRIWQGEGPSNKKPVRCFGRMGFDTPVHHRTCHTQAMILRATCLPIFLPS